MARVEAASWKLGQGGFHTRDRQERSEFKAGGLKEEPERM